MSPSRRGAKRTPLGALRRSWGHREQLEDFPGEVGAPRHRVTPQSWGRPRSVTPQSWGHPCSFTPRSWKNPHSVTPQSWGHLCVTPMVSDPKLGTLHSVTPQSWGRPDSVTSQIWDSSVSPQWCQTPKLGTPPQCHSPKLGSVPEVGVPPHPHHGVTSQSWGPPSGDPFCAPPIADSTVPMGWGRGAPFIFGIEVYFVITGSWGMPPPT